MSQDQYPNPQGSWPRPDAGDPPPYGATGARTEPYGSVQQPVGPVGPGQAGYVGGQWASPPAKRPGTATAGAVMAIIGGAVALLIGVLLAAVGNQMEEFGPILSMLGIVVAVVGVPVIVLAVLVLKGKFWAVIALTVMGAIWLVMALMSMIEGNPGPLIGVVWIGISVALMFAPQSRTWYRAAA